MITAPQPPAQTGPYTISRDSQPSWGRRFVHVVLGDPFTALATDFFIFVRSVGLLPWDSSPGENLVLLVSEETRAKLTLQA